MKGSFVIVAADLPSPHEPSRAQSYIVANSWRLTQPSQVARPFILHPCARTATVAPTIQMAELEELIDDLIYGGRAGDLDEIRESLAAGAPVDGRDANGTTALMMAAANGHVEAMQVLLSAGADINATNERENTSLHWAVFTGQEEAVKTLLAAGGCDVFVKNEQGLTAAMDAERAGKGELVVLILNSLDDEDAAAAALGIDEEKEAEGAEKPVERLAPQA